MTDGWTSKGKGALRFSATDQKEPLNGEVKTYTLPSEELKKLREETGYMVLSKEQYLQAKDQLKSDATICEEYDLPLSRLNLLKTEWGLIGKIRTPYTTTKVTKQQDNKDLPTPKDQEATVIKVPDSKIPATASFIADEIIKADPMISTVDLWIVMDTTDDDGPDSIKGIFNAEADAKIFIAEYVLSGSVNSDYLHLANRQVEIKG